MKPSLHFRRANTEQFVDFWKANMEPSGGPIQKPIRNGM